jgi:hypothetical protein
MAAVPNLNVDMTFSDRLELLDSEKNLSDGQKHNDNELRSKAFLSNIAHKSQVLPFVPELCGYTAATERSAGFFESLIDAARDWLGAFARNPLSQR